MESDISVAVISLSIVVLCWVVVRINQKLDDASHNMQHTNQLHKISDHRRGSVEDTGPMVEQTPESRG